METVFVDKIKILVKEKFLLKQNKLLKCKQGLSLCMYLLYLINYMGSDELLITRRF